MSYSQNNFLASIPTVTRNLLFINLLVWIACTLFKNIDLSFVLGLHYFQAESFYLYQLVTYMFTHVDFTHLFFNMFALFMFGTTLENYWGSKRFLIYYIVTGIGAGLVQEVVWYFSLYDVIHGGYQSVTDGRISYTIQEYINIHVTIGASGSIFGILLAFGMLFPNTNLYLMFIPIPIKAKYFVIGYGLIELYLGFANRTGDNVAHFAHLGGMLFGIFMILYWRKKDKKNGYYHF